MNTENLLNDEVSYPNETLELLVERASCRSFSDTAISPEIMNHILAAGIHAPSGGNLQPFSIIMIEKAETRKQLAEMCGQGFIADAPVNLLFCLDFCRLEQWAKMEKAPFTATQSFRHFWIAFQDTVMSAQNICTAADALGLGSVYIGTVVDQPVALRRMFDIPRGVMPVVLLCLGYPRSRPKPRKKLPADVIVHRETYWKMVDEELKQAFDEKYPESRIPLTPERLATYEETCRRVHGEEFARESLEKVKGQGYFNAVQNYFGLHYRADRMAQGTDEFLKIFEDAGFQWFSRNQDSRTSE